jgi:hypothetical protein
MGDEEQREEEELIAKKVIAIEIYNLRKRTLALGIGAIIFSLIIAIFAGYSIYGGATAAGIFSIGVAWLIKEDIIEMRYLKDKYAINKK